MIAKKSTITGKNFRRGGEGNFSGWPENIPCGLPRNALDLNSRSLSANLIIVDLREIVNALPPENETALPEIEAALPEIETSLPEIQTALTKIKVLTDKVENKYQPNGV